MSIKIIADSCCDLPVRLTREENIHVVPLTVTFGSRHFTENVDIDSKLFFKLLTDGKSEHPKTSQPNPEAFVKAFRDAAADGFDDILCICLSSGLSGTLNSARIASEIVREDDGFRAKIHLFDSLNASVGIGEMVLKTVEMVKSGKSIEEILASLNKMRTTVAFYCVLETLEFLRRGGRIGNLRAVLGELFKIKPMITFFKGVPIDVMKVRGSIQAKDAILKLYKTRSKDLSKITIVHADAYERAKDIVAEVERTFKNIKVSLYEAGAVIGCYCGPGAIGIVFEEKEPRWSES